MFCQGFSYCLFHQGVRYSGVSTRREVTVLILNKLILNKFLINLLILNKFLVTIFGILHIQNYWKFLGFDFGSSFERVTCKSPPQWIYITYPDCSYFPAVMWKLPATLLTSKEPWTRQASKGLFWSSPVLQKEPVKEEISYFTHV